MATARDQSLLAKLSPELRIEIFKDALKADCVLVHPRKQPKEHRFNNSLLLALVNDPGYEEAYEVFHFSNAFRVTAWKQLSRTLGTVSRPAPAAIFIKDLEFVNFARDDCLWKLVVGLLRWSDKMSRLRSLTIAYDAMVSDGGLRLDLGRADEFANQVPKELDKS